MTMSRLFKNFPWSRKGNRELNGLAALVEQTRGSSSWSADLPTRGVLAFVEHGEPISD